MREPTITIDRHAVTGEQMVTIAFPGKHLVTIYPHVFPADHVTVISRGDVVVSAHIFEFDHKEKQS